MTQINAYLAFDGNCREAMTFYHQCLGGDLEIKTFEGSPMAEKMPTEAQQKVMHANIKKDGLVLMASDGGGMDGALIRGNTISLSLNCSSDQEIEEYYGKLSEGGTIVLPLADQFWGAKFGMFKDKFGMDWMLNFDKNQS